MGTDSTGEVRPHSYQTVCIQGSASQSVLLGPGEGITQEPTRNAYCLFQPEPAESGAGAGGQPPVSSVRTSALRAVLALFCFLSTPSLHPEDTGTKIIWPADLVDHLCASFLVDLKADIQASHGPLCFFSVAFLLDAIPTL